ncbi:MAG: apolipoprotein N-acyltransferase [Cytophagales bacterium]|nr:apolipoprotein N-acyltransferase [Bernardetiaceae bacterium]MDW8210156.1 apolipoprotein N-acyltransferase [Cytophagales bacterium]
MLSLQLSRRYLFVLALAAGIMLGLAWYAYTVWLIFFGFAPLFAIEYIIRRSNVKRYLWWCYAYGYLAFLTWNAVATWWLWNASPGGAIFAFTANAALMAGVFTLFHAAVRASSDKFGYLLFFVLWLSFEYFHHHWGFSWPWLTLGNAFGFVPQWVQWYEYTGVAGGSIWVLAVNLMVFETLWKSKYLWKLSAVLTLMVALVPLTASLLVYRNYKERGPKVEVAVVQPNLDCYAEKFEYNAKTGQSNEGTTYVPYQEQVKRFIRLSKQVITPQTVFLLWPETSLHQTFMEDDHFSSLTAPYPMSEVAKFKREHPHVNLLTGADTYIVYPLDNLPDRPTIRKDRHGVGYEIFNTAVFIREDTTVQYYHKSKLVVGVESNPLAGIFRWLDDRYMLNLGGVVGNLGTQEHRTVFFSADSIGMAPIICYESAYGEFVTDYVKQNAHILGIITNDGWWGNTPGHVQHLALARLRAIETRRSVARAANTGISGFINQRGELIHTIAYGWQGASAVNIHANSVHTFYVRMGDALYRLATFLAAFMILSAFVRRKVRGVKGNKPALAKTASSK